MTAAAAAGIVVVTEHVAAHFSKYRPLMWDGVGRTEVTELSLIWDNTEAEGKVKRRKKWSCGESKKDDKLAVARIKLHLHHHVEWWISKKPQTAGGKATEQALYGKMINYEQRDDTDILGTDPAGPLAPLEGQTPLLQCSLKNQFLFWVMKVNV